MTTWPTRRSGSSPYDFSKTIVENVKENGEKTQGVRENPFWGLPYARDGIVPSQSIPTTHPFWEQDPLDWLSNISNQFWYLGCCNHGKLHCSPSHRTPGPHQGAPLPSNPSWEDAHLWETSFSSWSCSLPCLPGVPSNQLFLGGCTSVGNAPLGYFSFWLPILAALWPLPYLLPLCMHLFIVNIFDL